MLGLICICGGNLFRSDYDENGYEEYICDQCEREWFRCNLCNGDLHAYKNDGALEFLPILQPAIT